MLETAGLSDVGKKREGNEDAFYVDDAHQFYAVADGMGGHLAGEVASAIVVETLQAAVADQDYPLPGGWDESVSHEGNMLLAWIRAANRNVYSQAQRDERCRGMGSTLAAVYFMNGHVLAANVGDSPIYLVRNNRIELISVVHTVAVEQAALCPDRVYLLPAKFQHMLSRAIGVDFSVHPDICELPCSDGDVFIICSDGLSNPVSPEEMIAIAQQGSAGDACRRFVDLANERGGDDNITVIVIKVHRQRSRPRLLRLLSGLLRKRAPAKNSR